MGFEVDLGLLPLKDGRSNYAGSFASLRMAANTSEGVTPDRKKGDPLGRPSADAKSYLEAVASRWFLT